jgi:hypothetical protein
MVQLNCEELHRSLAFRAMDFAGSLTELVVRTVMDTEKKYDSLP